MPNFTAHRLAARGVRLTGVPATPALRVIEVATMHGFDSQLEQLLRECENHPSGKAMVQSWVQGWANATGISLIEPEAPPPVDGAAAPQNDDRETAG
jgi:hypothetical protein